MVVYCSKKICVHNSACCSHYDDSRGYPTCKLEDILIDDQVECANFKAEIKKIDICKDCSRRTGLISFNLDDDINVNLKEAPSLNLNNFNKKK